MRRLAYILSAATLLILVVIVGVYLLTGSGSTAPETQDLFPEDISHEPVEGPLASPVKHGRLVLLPLGSVPHDYKVEFPPGLAAIAASEGPHETSDVDLLTHSELYLAYLPLPKEYNFDSITGVTVGDEVTWLMASFRRDDALVRVTLQPYIVGDIESVLAIDARVELATINGHDVIVDYSSADKDSPAIVRGLDDNVGVWVDADRFEDAVQVARYVFIAKD
jgi:hypothetical protein